MSLLFISFAVACLVTWLVIRMSSRHLPVFGDTDQHSPQKFHVTVVPRVGGIGIAAGATVGLAWAAWTDRAEAPDLLALGLCALIAFTAGFIEDLTKRVTPRQRLLATMLAAAAAMVFVDGIITRTDIPGLDLLLEFPLVAWGLTVVAVAGVANSVNIIDGFNGLASMCVAIMLTCLAVVAFNVGDLLVLQGALLGLGAVLGFFVWNYPKGRIFLGDGGAYCLGFWAAELGILLVHRHQNVSPLFPLLLCAYPIFETVFTMYRRKVLRGRPVGQPDASHLHSLIYRRLMRWAIGKRDTANLVRRNSMTAPYLWLLCSLSAIPAVMWWDESDMLAACLGIFCLVYLLLYRSIVLFKTPRWLVRRSAIWAANKASEAVVRPSAG